METSALQKERATYKPKLPKALKSAVKIKEGEPTQSVDNHKEIKNLFPNTYGMPLVEFVPAEKQDSVRINVGVILSGGQAPGGHNVISGLYDEVKKLNPENRLFGFLMGPEGLVNHNYIEITETLINKYRNTGGFDLIGSGRTKLEKEEQFEKALEIIRELDIRALVIVGGDDSNTNACVLAEYYAAKNYGIQVIGCPKTIDGDLKNNQIETSFGFDTATKTYSELIGNIARDCNSARKYWHFIKLMGRSASHIALECALQTQPNICLISEEIETKDLSLNDIIEDIAKVVARRAQDGRNYGVVLIPDLSEENKATFETLPDGVARQLSLDRDPHGNVQVSLIETERLISDMVEMKLNKWAKQGKYNGHFATIHHFLGYEGRCAAPSNFDADYCYALGTSAAQLIANGKTGYMAIVKNTTEKAENWIAGGVPITMMMNMERRNGELKPVIRKALVDLEGAPFKKFVELRDKWAKETSYIYPGPIQYWGPSDVCDQTTRTLALEQGKDVFTY